MTLIARCDWWQVNVSPRTRWWFLRITSAERESGYGECSDGATAPEMERALGALASEIQLSEGPADANGLLTAWRMRRDTALSARDRHLYATIAGALECALEDVAAQRAGVPMWRRHASAASTDGVRLYANINRAVGERTPTGFARAAVAALADGFTTIKCAPFVDDPPDGQTLAEAGLERIVAVRNAVGSNAQVLVDAHARLPLAEMLAILPELEQLAIAWLEDPVPFRDLAGLRQLRDATSIQLAGGRQALTLEEIAPTLREGLLDIVTPDAKHAGFLTTLAISRYACGLGLRVSLHNPTGPIATAASLHAAAAMPYPDLLEFAYDAVPARSHMISPPERVQDATFRIPDGPGLGVALVPPAREKRF